MTALAKVFYLFVETGSMFHSSGVIANPAGLLYDGYYK
jgi:hypothetical protein